MAEEVQRDVTPGGRTIITSNKECHCCRRCLDTDDFKDYRMVAECITCGHSCLYLQTPASFCVVIAGVPYQGSCMTARCVVCGQSQLLRPRYTRKCRYCGQVIDWISPTRGVEGWGPTSRVWFNCPEYYSLNTGLDTDKIVYDSGGPLWVKVGQLLGRI